MTHLSAGFTGRELYKIFMDYFQPQSDDEYEDVLAGVGGLAILNGTGDETVDYGEGGVNIPWVMSYKDTSNPFFPKTIVDFSEKKELYLVINEKVLSITNHPINLTDDVKKIFSLIGFEFLESNVGFICFYSLIKDFSIGVSRESVTFRDTKNRVETIIYFTDNFETIIAKLKKIFDEDYVDEILIDFYRDPIIRAAEALNESFPEDMKGDRLDEITTRQSLVRNALAHTDTWIRYNRR